MIFLEDVFDPDLFIRHLKDGLIRVQKNDSGSLWIANYTEKAAFDKRWDQVTLNCRGLIYNTDDRVVARPWKKFFNYGEGRLYIDDVMPVEVTNKMDGSLGILYWTGESWAIATRGSFASDQAIHATKLWNDRYSDLLPPLSMTFLFEIVYPKNRIVLNYGDLDDLVLLGAVNIDHGFYYGPLEAAGLLEWPGPITEVFPYKNMTDAFAAEPRDNAEGFVVRSGTEMVKIKQNDYIELHRIVTNLSPLSLWRRLAAGDTLEAILEYVPDEWHEWLATEYQKLDDAYEAIAAEVLSDYNAVNHKVGWTAGRKEFAQAAVKTKYSGILFAMKDGKAVNDMIMKLIRPKGNE